MINVGIIGLGYISTTHLENFSKLADAQVVAVADSSEACITACLDLYDIPQSFTDYHDLLTLDDLDLVVICLPNVLHAPVAIAALNAGHHVLCEKPMAASAADAEAMIKAAEDNHRMLSIAMNFRWQFFGPDVFHLKKIIENGELGDIYYIRVHYLRRVTFPAAGYERWNLSQEESGGGVLIDLGSHMLDLAMWLLDDYSPQSVSGFTHNGLMNYSPVEDFASGVVSFANGTRIQTDLAWNSHNQSARQIHVYGENGGVVIDAEQPPGSRIRLFTLDDNKPATETVSASDISSPPEATLQEHVVKQMIAGKAPECSAEKALLTMRVIEGWYQSSASGNTVTL